MVKYRRFLWHRKSTFLNRWDSPKRVISLTPPHYPLIKIEKEEPSNILKFFMDNFPAFTGEPAFRYGISSLILLFIIFALRFGIYHGLLERSELTAETKRRWNVNIRNALIFLFVVGLLFIWAPRLQTFAVSLFAIALAITLATKELIDCSIGAGLRAITRAYSIGDRIELGEIRGQVIDHHLFTTTLLEIGPGQTSHQYTGRVIFIPNSFLLKHTLTNETYSKDYRLHIFTIPLSTDEDWKSAETYLLEIANEECQPYLQEAKQKMKKLEGKLWLDAPSVEPRVTIQFPEPGQINLLIRIPCPTHSPSRIEQAIIRKFLSRFSFVRRHPGETPSFHK